VNGKRILLLGVAGLLSATALLAIGILLVGHFGETQGKVLGSTALLAGFGLVALPAVILLDQGRARTLALASAALAAAAAALALGAIWSSADSATLGRTVGTMTIFAVAGAQVAALTARRRAGDPPVVRRLFVASCATAVAASAFAAAVLWSGPNSNVYARLVGSLVVLDLLLVALQPILARARPAAVATHRLRVLVDEGEPVPVSIEGGDLASAAARAIRSVEREGGRVVGLEVELEDRPRIQLGREPREDREERERDREVDPERVADRE